MCCKGYFAKVRQRLNRRQGGWAIRQIDPDVAWVNHYGRELVGLREPWIEPPYPMTNDELRALEAADERLLRREAEVEWFSHLMYLPYGPVRVVNHRTLIHCDCGRAVILISFFGSGLFWFMSAERLFHEFLMPLRTAKISTLILVWHCLGPA